MKIALCQINPWVGNLVYNLEKIKLYYKQACLEKAELVVFPESVTTGYPAEDLVLKPEFMDKVKAMIEEICAITAETAILLGSPYIIDHHLYNTAILIQQGKIISITPKTALPNYGVFDEKRVFHSKGPNLPVKYKDINLGIMICEDMWVAEVARYLKQHGAECLLVINGSPFSTSKEKERFEQARLRIKDTGLPLIYLNLVGGQDNIVFDGRSFIMDQKASVIHQMPNFTEKIEYIEINKVNHEININSSNSILNVDDNYLLYKALTIGLTDYINKNRFKGVILGLSGGIDSALSAAIAVDALGADKVSCVMMPSPYIQSRIRGMILMAISNKLGKMVLSTGNKSEMAVGYATLYGDMCGGYNALKDVYKTKVFELSIWRNNNYFSDFKGPKGQVMPERVITRPPSAELRPDQKDQDSLPPYEILDNILYHLIELETPIDEIKEYDKETILKVMKLLDKAEYKRRQSPPGPKVTNKALTLERRYPITNGFYV